MAIRSPTQEEAFMRPSEEPTKRQPTRAQQELLARISNPQQRRALISAIGNGEEIPSYAWTPVTEENWGKIATALEKLQQGLENARKVCREQGTTFEELVEFDPEAAAEATHDENRLKELIWRMEAADTGRSRLQPRPPQVDSFAPFVPDIKESATYHPVVNQLVRLSRRLWKAVGRIQHLALATVRKTKSKNVFVALVVFLFCYAAGVAAFLLAAVLQGLLILIFMVLGILHVFVSAVIGVFSRTRARH
jgi:hypothetical protein